MSDDFLCRTILPSGRAVEYVEISTGEYLTIQQRVASKIGARKDPNGLLSKTLTVVELIATCVKRISKNCLPFTYKKVEKVESADIAESFLPPEHQQKHADVDAMVKDEYISQFGGWMEATYTEMLSEKSPMSIKRVFGKLTDFNALAALIVGDSDDGVVLGKAVVRSSE